MNTNDLVKISKDFFIKSACTVGKAAVFSYLPFLNVPPINYFIKQAIDWLVGKIADGLETVGFFVYVDMRVDTQGKEYVEAAHNANRLQTEEARKIADEKFKSFGKFNSY